MAVRSIANGSRRHTTEADLVEEEELAAGSVAGVEEMWRVGEACRTAIRCISLAEERLQDV